jgi:Molecular chaperone GrpE (heat shock protein)
MTHKKKDEASCENCNSMETEERFDETESFQPESISEDDATDSKLYSENAALQKRTEELTSAYLTLAADFENYKKRNAKNIEDVKKFAAEPLMKDLAEVADNFERAVLSAENENTDKDSIREGIKNISRQFMTILESHGLSKIPAEPGMEFDPHLHESVAQISTNQYPEETIVNVLKFGYTLNGKIIRAASVTVSSGEE